MAPQQVRTPLPVYSVGTVAGTSGQPIITGTGTAWTTLDAAGNTINVVQGGDVLVTPAQAIPIRSVDSATQITLELPLAAALPVGSVYRIIKYQPNYSGGVTTALAALMAAGSDASPDQSRTVDNGASRLKFRVGTGKDLQLAVGASGAADAALLTALSISPQTGVVTMVQGGGRTTVADVSYTGVITDRTIAYSSLTAARVVSLPATSAYPTGTLLLVVDESGACSATTTITVARAGTDTINGAASAVIALAYGFVALTSNGAGKWTVVDQSTASLAQQAANAVAVTGGKIDGTTIGATAAAPAKVTTLTATGASVIGGLDSASRYAAFDTFGRITWRFDDNGYVSGPILNNFGLTAAGQGADALKVNLGAGGTQVATAGMIRLATTDAFTSTGTASSKWQFYAATAGNFGIGLEVTSNMASSPILRASASLTVAQLPAPGTAGRMVFCSNARMLTSSGTLEAAGSGTGGLVVDNGTAWRVAGTNITASA